MEDDSIKNYIETIVLLFATTSSETIDYSIIENAKKNYPITEILTFPDAVFFDYCKLFYRSVLNEILYTLSDVSYEMYLPLSLDSEPVITKVFIDSISIIAKHSKLYSSKEIRFNFSILRDIMIGVISKENIIKFILIHLYHIGKNELREIVIPFLKESYYCHLKANLKYMMQKIGISIEKECKTNILMMNQLNQLDESYEQSRLDLIWKIYKNDYLCCDTNQLDLIEYDDIVLFHMCLLYYPINLILCRLTIECAIIKFMTIIQEPDDIISFFNKASYSDILQEKITQIIMSKPVNNYYTNESSLDDDTRNNYTKFIEYLEKNNNKIPKSAIDYYIIPLIMGKEYSALTSHYQRIAINSYYECFEMKNIDKNKNKEEGYENLTIKETLMIAALIMILLYECNHFLRKYNTYPDNIESITISKDETRKSISSAIFGG